MFGLSFVQMFTVNTSLCFVVTPFTYPIIALVMFLLNTPSFFQTYYTFSSSFWRFIKIIYLHVVILKIQRRNISFKVVVIVVTDMYMSFKITNSAVKIKKNVIPKLWFWVLGVVFKLVYDVIGDFWNLWHTNTSLIHNFRKKINRFDIWKMICVQYMTSHFCRMWSVMWSLQKAIECFMWNVWKKWSRMGVFVLNAEKI